MDDSRLTDSNASSAADVMDVLDTLIDLLLRYAYREGEFVLSSGRSSTYLIDVKKTALHPAGGRALGRLMRDAVRRHFPATRGVGGRTLGADPLAMSIALASLDDGGPPLEAFIVRKEPKGHGTANLIESSGALEEGAPVTVLEDVVTTGGSAMHAVEAVRAAGYDVQGVLGLVDRQEGGAERFAAAGVPFVALLTIDDLRARRTASRQANAR